MDLEKRVYDIAEKHLPDESIFMVDVVIKSNNGPKKVLVLIDGDEGLNIDTCADLSRLIGNEIEENNVIGDAYRLEVSSPGTDHPLTSIRQYKKNIGRQVKVYLQDTEVVGVLKAADENRVVLDKEVKKGKKKDLEEVEIPLSDIKKTIVQISFK
ncbi:ribosome maturation factor RimP [Fulvivirga sediminis]|uniref:Ribosome maturation factor RimP n=1 Tax=Fulvivirga sediminis TaxID=2803949 RepID=A0A937F9E6_9BACT|nr:ribosome maturation factor RimP [Fulvivirga sediminis]MBL3657044.1 ribosome maturation factor RimP [Fulvivirga sediminis]